MKRLCDGAKDPRHEKPHIQGWRNGDRGVGMVVLFVWMVMSGGQGIARVLRLPP